MQASSPSLHLLDRFPLLRSRSPDEARELIGRIFSPHRLAMRGKERALDVRHNRVRLSQLGINVLTYGVPVEIDQRERGDFYMLMHPLRGQATTECGGQSVTLDANTMGILSPREATRMEWSGDCEMILLEVPRLLFDDVASAILGKGKRPGQSLPRASQAVAAWWQSVLDMTHSLSQYGDQWLAQPRMQLAMEEYLVAGLHTLFANHHAMPVHCAVLSETRQRALRKAIDYIHAHASDRLTVVDIASAACVSPRTLEVAFRRRYGQSPLGFLRGVQLDRVHQALQAARLAQRPVQVTDIAMANGFTHMGRFACYYKQRFGISPTLTLRGT